MHVSFTFDMQLCTYIYTNKHIKTQIRSMVLSYVNMKLKKKTINTD